MTLMDEQVVTCPECGNEQNVRLYHTLNVSLDPELKRDLINGEVNLFECDSCDFKSFVPCSLLYNDMELKFCVQLVPLGQALEEDFLKNFDIDGAFKALDALTKDRATYLSRPHVVFDMQELASYVIFRDKLHEYHEHA
jgi:hypothetical protein